MKAKRGNGLLLYSIPVLLALCHVFHEVAAQECRPSEQKREASILGVMLQRHIFKTITGATLGDVCLRECYRDVRCQSFNFVISQDMCELNNRTKEARPEDFVLNSDRYYFRRDWKRGEFFVTGKNISKIANLLKQGKIYHFAFQQCLDPFLNCLLKPAKKSRPVKEGKRSAANIGSILLCPGRLCSLIVTWRKKVMRGCSWEA